MLSVRVPTSYNSYVVENIHHSLVSGNGKNSEFEFQIRSGLVLRMKSKEGLIHRYPHNTHLKH